MSSIPKEYDDIYKQEGWAIFVRSGNTFEIERINTPEDDGLSQHNWPGDDAVISHVIAKALAGSVPHAFALWMDGRQTDNTATAWIPGDLLPGGVGKMIGS